MKLNMSGKRNLQADGRVLGTTLAIIATNYLEEADEATYETYLHEYLVLCHSAFEYLAVGCQIAEEILEGADDEFSGFNPDHQKLLQNRRWLYLEAICAVQVGDASTVGQVFAQCVGGDADDAAWAAGAFTEAIALFSDLAAR